MYAGRIVETGTAAEVFAAPAHPYTHGLLDCIPVPGKTERGSKLGSIPGIVPSLIGDMTGCMFRNRCPYAVDRCAAQDVELRDMGPGRGSRCLFTAAELESGTRVGSAAQ
jgi:peptide/nickel transport system ATP-binding protein